MNMTEIERAQRELRLSGIADTANRKIEIGFTRNSDASFSTSVSVMSKDEKVRGSYPRVTSQTHLRPLRMRI